MIPIASLRPTLVQALSVEVPNHMQKDEYIHAHHIDTHTWNSTFKKDSYTCRELYVLS